MIAADPYGKFIPGPLRGLPQYVTASGLVEGNLASPVAVPSNVRYFDTPFLTDIAHNADPTAQCTPTAPAARRSPSRTRTTRRPRTSPISPRCTYDDEMLNAHFACGDGRCNENIALSTIHQVFHSEHDRLVDYIKGVLTADTSTTGVTALAQWKLPVAQSPDGWNGERLFQAARFVTEMEYQHLVFEEFARKVQPASPAVPRLQPGHQPGRRGRVRPRGLPLRPLDARRRRALARPRTPTAARPTTRSRC